MTESADETGLFGAARSSPQGEAVLTAKMQLAALLRGTNLRSLTAEALRVELLKLLEGYQIQSIPYNYQQVWHRARVVEKGDCYSSLDQLIYPASGNSTTPRTHEKLVRKVRLNVLVAQRWTSRSRFRVEPPTRRRANR